MEKTDLDILIPEPEIVYIGEKSFELRPFTLRKLKSILSDIGEILDRLVKEYPNLELSNRDQVAKAFAASEPLFDAFTTLLANIVSVDANWLEENMTLTQCVEIVKVIWEQNSLGELLKNLSNLAPKKT